MRTIFDPAANDAIQSEAKHKTGGDAEAHTGSGRERHDAQHVAAPRSEGDANPQLTGPLQDGIGDYAVQAYRGETQRQYGERAKEHGDETRPRILRLSLDPAFEVPHVVEVLSGQIPRREITYTKV
jgi:hypothetical protein